MMRKSPDEILIAGRLNGNQRNRLAKLLDMMYTPKELAREVGFAKRQVYRVYIPAGCPHERDSRQHIWINGKAFREWVREVYKKRELAEDEAFCLTCRKPVKMSEPEKRREGRLIYWVCECPSCGRKLARIIDKQRR